MKLIKTVGSTLLGIGIVFILYKVTRSGTKLDLEYDQEDKYNPYIWEGIDESLVRYNPETRLYEPIDPDVNPYI